MNINRLTIFAMAFLLLAVANVGLSAPESSKDNWRKVLTFDVLDIDHEHKANLDGGKILVASWKSGLGWDVEVFRQPRTKSSLNLLYDGHNWHGIQPWMVFAWAKHEGTFADERVISYEGGRSKVMIVLIDCKTKQIDSNSYAFTQGQIQVFHSP